MGFVVKNGTEQIQFYIELTADGNILMPVDIDNLIWNNKTIIRMNDNMDYWEKSTYVCSITKKQLIHIRDWIVDIFKPTHSFYAPFNIVNDIKTTYNNPISRSSICTDFCTEMFQFIQKDLKVSLNFITMPKAMLVNLICKEYKKLDMTNINERNEVINYYKQIRAIFVKFGAIIDTIIGGRTDTWAISTKLLIEVYLMSEEMKKNALSSYIYGYDMDNTLHYYKVNKDSVMTVNYVLYPITNDIISTSLELKPYLDDNRLNYSKTFDPPYHVPVPINDINDINVQTEKIPMIITSVIFVCILLNIL